jgi:type III restriction enzyme
LLPGDLLDEISRAKIVITNYHAFKLRERIEISRGGPAAPAGPQRRGAKTLETEGQMLQRVMPELMGLKNILVINDEAHHCYREKPKDADDEELKGDERKEAEKNNEAARLWISGLEAVNRKLGVDPRHRPLGDALLPARLRLCRGHAVPVDGERLLADGRHRMRHRQTAARAGRREHPRRRAADVPQPLGAHRQGHAEEGPRPGRRPRPPQAADATADGPAGALRPLRKTFELWQANGIKVPPCFIVVCQNTAISKLVYDFISGFQRKNDDGTTTLENGRLPLFRNFDEPRQARCPARTRC